MNGILFLKGLARLGVIAEAPRATRTLRCWALQWWAMSHERQWPLVSVSVAPDWIKLSWLKLKAPCPANRNNAARTCSLGFAQVRRNEENVGQAPNSRVMQNHCLWETGCSGYRNPLSITVHSIFNHFLLMRSDSLLKSADFTVSSKSGLWAVNYNISSKS